MTTTRPLRVLLLSVHARPDKGWGTMTYELCRQFMERDDVSFELLLPADAQIDGLPFADRIRRTLPRWTGSFHEHPLRMLAHAAGPIAHGPADVVHTIVEFSYGVIAARLAARAGVPHVISAQGTYAVRPFLRTLDRRFFRKAVRTAAIVTAPAQFTVSSMREQGDLDAAFRVFANPVNYQKFQTPSDPAESRRRFGFPQDATIVFGLGALKRRKGFDVLIRGFANIAQARPHAWLAIGGEGSERPALEALIRDSGVADRIRLLGYMEDADVVRLYQCCDIYSHLPRNEHWNFEAYGIVYLEAGACGVPSIGTRSGGVPEAVLHEQTGLLVDEDDVDGTAQALARLIDDPVLVRTLGAAARDFAAAHDWNWYADAMVRCYREATRA